MARLIDAAKTAEMWFESLEDRSSLQTMILPSERQCDYDGSSMTLIQKSDGKLILRIHTCRECGFVKKYGGSI